MFRCVFTLFTISTPFAPPRFQWLPKLFFLGLVLANFCPAFGEDITAAFIAPTKPLLAANEQSLWLYCMNNSDSSNHYTLNAVVPGKLVSDSGTNDVALSLKNLTNDLEVEIAPGTFYKAEYALTVPAIAPGRARLDILKYNQIFIEVVPAAPPDQNPVAETPTNAVLPAVAANPTPATLIPTSYAPGSALMTFFNNHMYRYEPIYFLLGSYPAAEFQFSLKYKMLNGTSAYNPLGNLYFAYTQTSYWDLLSTDPSFYDTSYKPSTFLYYPDIFSNRFAVHLDLQGGVEHESNGRGGPDERSLNTLYIQPTFTYDLTTNLMLTVQPRAWYYLSKGEYNKDLQDYRGYADLYTAITWHSESWEKIQLSSKLRVGDSGWHTGEQVDLTFFLPPLWNYHFNPALQVQYFAGYGQTLRQYNIVSHGIRGGLCLSF